MPYYHAKNKSKSFFEGWYFKHQTDSDMLTFIPSVHINNLGEKTAYLQVIYNANSYQIEYPFSAFYASKKKLGIKLDQNLFSRKGISINLKKDDICITGKLYYGTFTKLDYDIMGPFCAVPFMECNHGVISLKHTIKGQLSINGKMIDFANGIGYIEKDWGRSFPKTYLWTQCNDRQNDCSIMLSVANIPFIGKTFRGMICVIEHQNTQYRLATYLGARVEWWNKNHIIITQGKSCFQVEIEEGTKQKLLAPKDGTMSITVHENTSCHARYRFYNKNKKAFDFEHHQACFEMVE